MSQLTRAKEARFGKLFPAGASLSPQCRLGVVKRAEEQVRFGGPGMGRGNIDKGRQLAVRSAASESGGSRQWVPPAALPTPGAEPRVERVGGSDDSVTAIMFPRRRADTAVETPAGPDSAAGLDPQPIKRPGREDRAGGRAGEEAEEAGSVGATTRMHTKSALRASGGALTGSIPQLRRGMRVCGRERAPGERGGRRLGCLGLGSGARAGGRNAASGAARGAAADRANRRPCRLTREEERAGRAIAGGAQAHIHPRQRRGRR